jgi:hypothetical protein
MRIRTIKPEFFTHDGIFEAEEETGLPLRLAYIGLWCAADREGRFRWEPRRLRVQILPYDDVDFSRVLDALTTRGFLVKYASEGREFGAIPSFPRHQIINNRERESELPEPLNINIIDACPTRDPREHHAGKAEGKGREGNMEGNKEQGRDGDVSATPPAPEPAKPKRQKFQKPTLDEWTAYAKTMPEPLAENQALGAWDYYEGNGWRVGRNPMADWQATLRAWARRQKDFAPARSGKMSYEEEERIHKPNANSKYGF